ncbi:MAG: CBS domain-containing protein [Candidatus Omnitrophica bacterium]|nr:CBS domain-containing protein [Candidatus Omnitrophota bacterium]
MRLKDILKTKVQKVWSVRTDEIIQDALSILVNNKIGALLVFNEHEHVVGILSERDIMRECYQNGTEWAKSQVEKVMTRRVIVAKPEDEVSYIMGIMTQNRIRHVPVMDGTTLVGVISIGDVVKAQLKDSQYENQYLKDYITGV